MATAVTIGNFDGVHVGHAALLRRCRELAGERGRVVALAFDPHPAGALGAQPPPRLTAFEERSRLLRDAGADEVERLDPTPEFLGTSAEGFVAALAGRHSPRFIVEGGDFHFGKGRAGDMRLLERLGDAHGFQAITVPPAEVALTDQLVARASSTLVRWLLAHGRVRDAAIVLGRPYEVAGTVVQGDRRGRDLGVPTANLDTPLMLPADGVYAGEGRLPDGRVLPAAVNVGTRPTFGGAGRRLEAHLITGSGYLGGPRRGGHPWQPLPSLAEYGWVLRVRLLAWVREDVRFDSVDALVGQMGRDIQRCRQESRP